jgi:Smg protein
MFDVLVYLYENYWRPDACPAPALLSRKLSAAGFESDEIEEALHWLDGLSVRSADEALTPQASGSHRIYTSPEQDALGEASLAFISFLESAGVLTPALREVVVERAVAAGPGPIDIEDLKIIVLMVFWSFGEEPDALILDELFVDDQDRLIH